MEKTCCVTGHRDMDTEQMEEIRDALKKEVEKAVEDGTGRTGFCRDRPGFEEESSGSETVRSHPISE